jgi:methyl-accepting chemotaxis protein
MPRLTDMSLGIRTIIAFGLVLFVTIGLGAFSFYQLVAIDRASSELADKVMSSLFQSGQVLRMVINFRREEANRLLSLTADDGRLREKLMQDYAEQVTAIRSQYRPSTPDEQANIRQFDSLWPQFMETTQLILTKLNEGDRDAAHEYYVNDNRVQFDAIHAALDKVLELTNQAGRRAYDAADEAIDQARLGVVIALVVATGIALAAGIVTFVTTAFPIRRLTRAMERLSEHDLDTEIPDVDRHDEIGAMARAVQVFLNQALGVRGLTTQIMENIRRVAMAASQASSAVSQVSDGSNIQLKSLKQSSGALEQSAKAITEVARGTQLASERARHAADLVDKEIRQMTGMVDLVGAISKNSTQINRIADAISRIASQTNMLSLNASIEAARAGEHGRGFAVVAEEVGKLAGSSRSLAADIAEQVRQATEQAEKGVAVAREVSGKMQEIAGGVAETDKLIGAIATAMEQQQATIAGINANVGELTRIGQSNATAAEEITATMLDLSRLAERTRLDVDEFKQVSG